MGTPDLPLHVLPAHLSYALDTAHTPDDLTMAGKDDEPTAPPEPAVEEEKPREMPSPSPSPSPAATKEQQQQQQTGKKPNGPSAPATAPPATNKMAVDVPELDDFGLPIRKAAEVRYEQAENADADASSSIAKKIGLRSRSASKTSNKGGVNGARKSSNAGSTRSRASSAASRKNLDKPLDSNSESDGEDELKDAVPKSIPEGDAGAEDGPKTPVPPQLKKKDGDNAGSDAKSTGKEDLESRDKKEEVKDIKTTETEKKGPDHKREISLASTVDTNGMGEFSHQQLTTKKEEKHGEDDVEWQTMPAYAPYDIYDDDNRLIAREHDDAEDEKYGYAGLGGAGKGYTRVIMDDDAESATSMDENTSYLFKDPKSTSMMDEEQRDAVSQMQATKDLLTEGQRIAYVGLTRLELSVMVKEAESIDSEKLPKTTKKIVNLASESMKMWAQKMMIRLYSHMDISAAEQVMIEQLSEHGVMPQDLTPLLMANSRVKNPMADGPRSSSSLSSNNLSLSSPRLSLDDEAVASPPPPYETHEGEELPDVRTPSQLPTSEKIDIDLRWTVLCDLFLVLIADSVYDARSRVLLERVGKSLEIPWLDICKFEKKVTDALEMQQEAEKENWNEDEHKENRRKMALKRRYVMMGLATVGGGLVIGLSAGLLAPVIGAGLAAGFTTIGVTGTGSFLAGAGGAAIITSSAVASGSIIGGRAANRRTGAVKTFEYRPLHNNKRVNLIVTVAGWMTGKVDDIRLPFSTVDPMMGDIYSVLWEPEMLTSMGDTINILATEALTQGLQQVLGSTILISLMAALQLPVVLTKLSYLIDNPWAVSLDRATSAGQILADSLIDRNLGTRPVTLVGYSLGSRVIFSCLLELAKKGALGLIQNVYMFGSPVVVKQDEWLRARTVVAGRFVNGFNRNDWILGYLFRLTNGGIRRVAGLAPIEGIQDVENMDVTEHVVGHMDYRTAMPRLMRECGWMVESDEFTEIEDPDPENHNQRQRELINEIEEARKELEKEGKPKKGAFGGFFSRKKKTDKAEWEVYEEQKGNKDPNGPSRTEDQNGNNHGVLFDIDAIRAELAKDQLQVKELQSTLPPMKIPSPSPSPAYLPPVNPRDSLRETKTTDAVPYRPSHEYRLSGERTPTIPATQTFENNNHGFESRHGDNDDGIQMTFDTSFEDDAHGKPLQKSETNYHRSASPAAPVRPEMKTSQTVPNIALADPWADPDDDDFGKEKEISMTFA